jgi:hypothetical protein
VFLPWHERNIRFSKVDGDAARSAEVLLGKVKSTYMIRNCKGGQIISRYGTMGILVCHNEESIFGVAHDGDSAASFQILQT